ncbi:hypothetical protein ACFY1S_06885 [Micromonospora sp. NPDC000663]|uniref:hypothetical protein n=1 Tax=Micromonospora sp. NPDC000663 TaxID=3364218 RepID=UPI0036B96B45
MHDVRRLLGDDLTRHPAPPLGDLVQQAMVQGRRLRRRRRLAGFGGGSALVLLLVVGLAVGPFDRFGAVPVDVGAPAGPVVGSSAGTPATASPPPPLGAPGAAAAPGPLRWAPAPPTATRVLGTVGVGRKPVSGARTTTPQAALELLTRLLPRGKTSHYAMLPNDGAGPGMPFVQLYLDRGKGPGMLRLSIYQDERGGDPPPGTVELTELPDNCVQDRMVTVHHGRGLRIDLLISACLEGDGNNNPAATPALSVEEAVDVAANPLWGTEMPADIVASGAKTFTPLARSNG